MDGSKYLMRSSVIVMSFFIFLFIAPVNTCPAEMALIKIKYRNASSMLPLVKTMLSSEGKAAVDRLTNSILVTDRAENLNTIREFLAAHDKPVPQVRVRFRFQEERVSDDRDISASGRVSGKHWSLSTGGRTREGVSVRVRDRKASLERTSESFITVLSGSAAYISVGKRIPFTERWIYLSRRYAHFSESVSFQYVETGMDVKPVVSGDHVYIDIIPRVSYEDRRHRGVIRFTEASTRLFVPRGRWVSLGGHSKESNEVIRQILSKRSAGRSTNISLSLMVEP